MVMLILARLLEALQPSLISMQSCLLVTQAVLALALCQTGEQEQGQRTHVCSSDAAVDVLCVLLL